MDGPRFDNWTRQRAVGMSRRRVLRGFTAGAVGLAGMALGKTVAVAAPNQCNAMASLFFPPGPGRAAFQQVCKRCDANLERICETSPASFTCCPPELTCCFDCTENTPACGEPDPVDPFCCAGTVPV